MACCGSAKAKDHLKAGWLKFFLIAILFGGGGLFSITYLTFARGLRWFPLSWRVLLFFILLPHNWVMSRDRKQIASLPVLLVFWIFLVVYGLAGLVVLYGAGVFFRICRAKARILLSEFFPALVGLFKELLSDAYVFRPDLKCVVSGKLFGYSPAFSGFVFKYFNLFVIMGMFGLVGLLGGAIVKLAA